MKLTTNVPAFRGEFSWLSNMHSCIPLIKYGDDYYPTIEHAYVAAKLDWGADVQTRVEYAELVHKGISAGDAKKFGRNAHMPHMYEWNQVDKVNLMYTLLKQKFVGLLADRLRATGELEIEELNYWKDTYWGICNGVGQNHLGKLIMRIRAELNKPF